MKQTSQSPKKKSVNPIPEGYHTVTPFLVVTQADLLLDFIKKAFNGEVTSRMLDDQGRVMGFAILEEPLPVVDLHGVLEEDEAMEAHVISLPDRTELEVPGADYADPDLKLALAV